MATPAIVTNVVLTNVPWLVRRISITGGATGAALTHGESYSPDFVIPVVTATGGTQTEVKVARATSATTLTVQTILDVTDAIDLYCFWLPQATGGQSTITTT